MNTLKNIRIYEKTGKLPQQLYNKAAMMSEIFDWGGVNNCSSKF